MLHIIGLGVDPDDEVLESALRRQRDARWMHSRRPSSASVASGCRSTGGRSRRCDLTADDALGRPTVARALVAAGFAESVEDAFSRLLGWGMPGYVPRTGLGPAEAIEVIRTAGGLGAGALLVGTRADRP